MTYEQQHCETCTCHEPKIVFDNDGIHLLNGAVMPTCDTCTASLYMHMPGAPGVFTNGAGQYHDTVWCRP